MSVSITIRDVPNETKNELAARAALSGRSLQEYLRMRLIEIASSPDADILMAQIRSRKDTVGSLLTPERIIAYRDADRR